MMQRIPEDFITSLVDVTDIVELVGASVSLKKAGSNYQGLCPFHDEKSPSFTVSPSKQFYHCFGCGKHGNAIGFLMEHSGMSFLDAIETLANKAGKVVPRQELTEKENQQLQQREKQYQLLHRAAEIFSRDLDRSAIGYLRSRFINDESILNFRIGYAQGNLRSQLKDVSAQSLEEVGLVYPANETRPAGEFFKKRIMFPVLSESGKVVGFGGRVLTDAKPKYINTPETTLFQKRSLLFGLYQAKAAIAQSREAIILEGYTDVIAFHQQGIKNSVAGLGVAITPAHVERLFRLADSIVIALDGDDAGRDAMVRSLDIVLPLLRENKTVSYVFFEEGHDPDSWVQTCADQAPASWAQLKSRAVPLSLAVINHITNNRNLTLPEDVAAAITDARKLLGKIGQAHDFRLALQSALEDKLGIPLAQRAVRKKPQTPHRVIANPELVGIHTNISVLCALDISAVERIPSTLVDEFSQSIITWFNQQARDYDERVNAIERMPSSSLRTFLHIGVERAQQLFMLKSISIDAEVRALISVLQKSAADRAHQQRIQSLLD